jgi:predicted nuclease of predicted toxin-antitoxin system
MRLCANENIGADTVLALRQAGHDVLWIREVAPGSTDLAVLARAQSETRLLLTFDKDFGGLVYQRGAAASKGIILFRIPQRSAMVVAERIVKILASRTDWPGHYSVVNDTTVRMRPLIDPNVSADARTGVGEPASDPGASDA